MITVVESLEELHWNIVNNQHWGERMAEQTGGNKTIHDPAFRIKTLDELNQKHNMYEGMITYFREDGEIPTPMKSVEELNKVREKATIYYGRSGEKYGAETKLTTQAQENVRLDYDGVAPEPDVVETVESDDAIGYQASANGLNLDYLSSLIPEDEISREEDMEKPEETGEQAMASDTILREESGLSEDELRIQQAIFGEVEEDTSVKTIADVTRNLEKKGALDENGIAIVKEPEPVRPKVYSRLELAKLAQSGELPKAEDKPKEPEQPKVLSRMELARQASMAVQNNASANTATKGKQTAKGSTPPKEDAVILKQRDAVTATGIMKEIVTLCVCVLIALVLAIVIVKYVGQKTEVSGDSMNDTLVNGQQLIIDKLTYRNHEPERYDIVVFPESDTTTFVKRIIGLPGETVSIKEGFVYVDGQMLSDDVYGKESITKDNYYRLEDSTVTLGENEYFVMGDNRNNSKDSRDYEIGNVTKDQFIGKVVFRIWPIKDIGVVK